MEDDYEAITPKETAYQQVVQAAENDRQERHNMRNRAQAQLCAQHCPLNETANLKRVRNPRNEDKLKQDN